MGHVVRETPWCAIDVDTTDGRVFFQQRWQYSWLVQPPLGVWTTAEKREFHQRADRVIWAAWSNRAQLSVAGASDFARRFAGRGIPINLDIRWVTAKPHWTVTVTKLPKNQFQSSSVVWSTRTITLDTNDFTATEHCHGTPKVCTKLVPVAHEFGHAAGNTSTLNRGDEYAAASAHKNDQGSIMNMGNQLRNRHFQTILEELNKMIADTTFTVARV